MTYLIGPRLHFAGRFEADVSTVNNSFENFDVHSPDQPWPAGGGWNSGGSGGCTSGVTSARRRENCSRWT